MVSCLNRLSPLILWEHGFLSSNSDIWKIGIEKWNYQAILFEQQAKNMGSYTRVIFLVSWKIRINTHSSISVLKSAIFELKKKNSHRDPWYCFVLLTIIAIIVGLFVWLSDWARSTCAEWTQLPYWFSLSLFFPPRGNNGFTSEFNYQTWWMPSLMAKHVKQSERKKDRKKVGGGIFKRSYRCFLSFFLFDWLCLFSFFCRRR